ncbi:MAG: bifunctional nuclease family protein [Bacteroidales bacterium]|nr:bifunctional nuclease family protein [Bacteroidales bacterium]
MKKIPLSVVAVTPLHYYADTYSLIMEEQDGDRRKFAVTIGKSEAQSIAVLLDGIKIARPLVYDFIYKFANSYKIVVEEVIIANVEKEIYYSEVVCRIKGAPDDEIVRLDSRTSDAVALAIKFGCPIYTYEVVFAAAGVANMQSNIDNDLASISTQRLQQMLANAIRRENYELATKIRDELRRRSSER